MSSVRIANSSPPRRASTSPSRISDSIRRVTATSSASPVVEAVAVVDDLEVVEVDEQDRRRPRAAPAAASTAHAARLAWNVRRLAAPVSASRSSGSWTRRRRTALRRLRAVMAATRSTTARRRLSAPGLPAVATLEHDHAHRSVVGEHRRDDDAAGAGQQRDERRSAVAGRGAAAPSGTPVDPRPLDHRVDAQALAGLDRDAVAPEHDEALVADAEHEAAGEARSGRRGRRGRSTPGGSGHPRPRAGCPSGPGPRGRRGAGAARAR